MNHLPHLIGDLGLILMAAAVVTLLFKKWGQPVVLGYLIAGFLVGPHFAFLPTVREAASISIWAEIGVIFMLFGLGLEFSFKKLAKVGKSASITAVFEIFAMLGVGVLTGRFLGWSAMDSLFLGGILSISSTTIIVRAFDELGLKGKGFVSLVFGVLVVEDLIAILLLVLLSSVAATDSLSGSALMSSSLRLVFFLVLWFVLGLYLLPTFLKKFAHLLSDETMLIVSLGLCLMMVMIATQAGFSPALGAFVMGSLLAETPKGRRIEHLIVPVKDLFSAVFFVSVGMLIDLQALADHFGVIVLVTVLTIGGKFASTTFGALISGRSLRHSVQTGMSLAQIGEFSFIIATLGVSLKVTSDFLYPIAVAVSALTTFSTPYLIKGSGRLAEWIERKLPDGVTGALKRYEAAMSSSSDGNVISLLWREYGIKIALNFVVVVAVTLAVERFVLARVEEIFGAGAGLFACVVTLIVSAPFLWAVLFGKPSHSIVYDARTAVRLRRLQLGVSVVRFLIGCGLVGFIVGTFLSAFALSAVLVIVLVAVGVLFFSRFSEPVYRRLEERFISNLTENERAELEKKTPIPELAPWDASLFECVLSPSSPLAGRSLLQSRLKETYGVTVAMIERAETRIFAPTRDDQLLPGDRLYVIGTEDQLAVVRDVIERKPASELPPLDGKFGLESLVLNALDPFIRRPIRDSGIREAINGFIVGIEREGHRFLNPDSTMELLPDDLVWLVGDRELIRALRSLNGIAASGR